MKRFPIYFGVLALALLLVMSAPVFADEVQGNVAWITPDDYTLTLVDNSNNIYQMRLDLTGTVESNLGRVTFWDIQPGDRVRVTFTRQGDELVVTDIRDLSR